MQESLFLQLCADFNIAQVQVFSQKKWRVQHYQESPGTLCSGLTLFWLYEKIHRRSPLTELQAPGQALLRQLAEQQARSYYPQFVQDYQPNADDVSLLYKKYGVANWAQIKKLVHDQHHADFLLYDLSRLYQYQSANIIRIEYLPPWQPCWGELPTESAVIMVFRYLRNGRSSGHRLAYYLDDEHRHHFFDPNAGEVIEPVDARFFDWLGSFFSHSSYFQRQPAPKESRLSLYRLFRLKAHAI